MSEFAKLDKIPNFIKAKSPQGLRRLMLQNNVRHATQFYYKILFANNEWYAWYYQDTNFKDILNDGTNGSGQA